MSDRAPNYKIFKEGRSAFFNAIMENPYEESSMAYREWQRGFNRGYFAVKGIRPGPARAYTSQ